MTPQQIQLKLENMKGKAFEYAKYIHIVKSYEISLEDEKFILHSDKNSFTRKFESAVEFFKYWFEQPGNLKIEKASKLQTESDVNDNNLPVVFEKENVLADELVKILKDNITKVQGNPNYIKQAQQINNNINSILHVQKLKLEMLKQIKKNGSK